MTILVLGGAGMLGHKVVQRLLGSTPNVWWTLRSGTDDPALAAVPLLRGSHAIPNVDALDLDRLGHLLRDLRPDVVVNCLGVIKQRPEVQSEASCMTLNAALPHRVADALASLGGRLIQISTDCVFSGSRGRYTEMDEPDAPDLYGQSKALGEVRSDNAVTLRTSFIGRELRYHHSLLDWFLSQNKQRIRGYGQVFWSGVTALHLAELIRQLIQKHPALTGLYHVSSGRISKLDLLLRLRDAFQLDVRIDRDDTQRRDLTLDGSRLTRAIGYRCPDWSVLIAELLADRTPYPAMDEPKVARVGAEP